MERSIEDQIVNKKTQIDSLEDEIEEIDSKKHKYFCDTCKLSYDELGICDQCGERILSKKEIINNNKQSIKQLYNEVKKLENQLTSKTNKIFRTSFFYDDKIILQQTNGGRFIAYDGSQYELKNYQGSYALIEPLEGEEIEKNFILLADKPQEYRSINDLVNEIKEFTKKYIDLPGDFRIFASYYVLLTWIYDKGNTVPYLRFLGDTGCGKSRALEVFGSLCYNYLPVSGAANSAPIFRVIEKWKGTLGFDESDLKRSDETNDIIKIINCGFERGKPVVRCEKNKPENLNFFDAYGPKIFAARKPFYDAATEGRCLSHTMQETKRTDIPSVLPSGFYKEAQEIRDKLLCFRLKNYRKINPDAVFELPWELEPRIRQLATPFSMVFSEGSEEWKGFVTFLLEYQKQVKEARLNSETGIILLKLCELVEESEKFIACKDLSESLNIPVHRISKELRSMGFTTETRHEKVNGKRRSIRAIVTTPEKWDSISRRYLFEQTTIPSLLCQTYQPCQNTSKDSKSGAHGTAGTQDTLLEVENFNLGDKNVRRCPE